MNTKPFDGNYPNELVEACKKGDRKAQYRVYQQYSKAMYNICVRITNSLEEAEDVLQEAFLSVFRNIQSYRGDATLGAWIKRIVVNHAINHVKARKLDVVALEHAPEAEQESGGEDGAPLSFDVAQVRDALRQLPDGYRIVFSLYLLEGYDHQEIAGILGISESASKSQYSRAKSKLRKMLG